MTSSQIHDLQQLARVLRTSRQIETLTELLDEHEVMATATVTADITMLAQRSKRGYIEALKSTQKNTG